MDAIKKAEIISEIAGVLSGKEDAGCPSSLGLNDNCNMNHCDDCWEKSLMSLFDGEEAEEDGGILE